ncbi:WhiB family transcriptional regulator [Streptomyces sp. NPDC042207]|uniref:WhiB family transcriptional regulator n=1 Tax=Streptomyces sp. NPDC042207 TaxID=3154331 RepID=UPI0033C33053
MTSLATLTARTPGLPCRIDPDLWFAESARDREAAVRACQPCPIRTECAAYAIAERIPDGVWGGTTAADRRSFADGRPWRFDEQGRLRQACGSVSAYHAHFSYREQPCPACVAAFEEQLLADRRQRLDAEHAKGGSPTGYGLHRRIGEPACELCLSAMRRQSAAARRARARRRLQRPRSASGASGAAEAVHGAPTAAQTFPLAS